MSEVDPEASSTAITDATDGNITTQDITQEKSMAIPSEEPLTNKTDASMDIPATSETDKTSNSLKRDRSPSIQDDNGDGGDVGSDKDDASDKDDLSDNDNYDYAFVRINKNTGKISRCKYSPGQIIFYSDFCTTDQGNTNFSPLRIYIEAKLFMPYNTSGGAARQYTDDRTDLTSVLWAGPEFLPSNIITDIENSNSLNHSNKYVKKLIIPPGCPKTLEIS